MQTDPLQGHSQKRTVVSPGEFAFAATHLDHGDIYGRLGGRAIRARGDRVRGEEAGKDYFTDKAPFTTLE